MARGPWSDSVPHRVAGEAAVPGLDVATAGASSRSVHVSRRLVCLLGAAGLVSTALVLLPRGPEIDDFGPVPDFVLTDQQGSVLSAADLRGQVWAASFIYTRCASVCPLLTAKFANVVRRTEDVPDLQFVSISVDPQHDSPEVLAAYAQRFGADPSRWRFATGPLSAIRETVVRGFKIHMGQPPAQDASEPGLIDIMHGEHFVVVDAEGRLRGYFRSDAEGLTAMEATLRALVP